MGVNLGRLGQHLEIGVDLSTNTMQEKMDSDVVTNAQQLKMNTTDLGTNAFQRKMACLFCEKMFTTAEGLRLHQQRHTGMFRFWCTECEKGFTVKTHYDAHMAKHEGITFDCKSCTKSFQSKRGLQLHIKSIHTAPLKDDAQTAPFKDAPEEKRQESNDP